MSNSVSYPPTLRPPVSGAAIASMILGILSIVLFCMGPLFGIPALICGHVALAHLKNYPQISGKGMAIAGTVMGYVSIGVMAFYLLLGTFFVSEAEKMELKRIAKLELVEPEDAEFHVILPKGHDPGKPVSVAVWLHGYGWNPSDLTLFEEAYQARADKIGVAFVGISATAARDEGGFEWAESSKVDRDYIRSVFEANSDKIIPQWPRVVLFGFSQGAKVAGDVASNYPGEFAGAILMSPGGENSYTDVPGFGEDAHEWQTYYCLVGADEDYGNVSLTSSYVTDLEFLDAKVIHKEYEGVEDHTMPPDFDEKLSEWIETILSVEEEAE